MIRVKSAFPKKALSILFFVFAAGCGSRNPGEPKPVEECVQYEEAFARCAGVHATIATQPAAMPSSEAERAELKNLCLSNMAQLKQACR